MALPAKRVALYVLIGSVVVSALIGIAALLSSEFGKLESKILLTSLCVTGASVLSLVCAIAWPRVRFRWLPVAGAALAIAGFALVVALLWAEADAEEAWKTAGSLLVLATAAALAALLALSRLAPRFAWSLPTALALDAVLAAYVVFLTWEAWDFEDHWRVFGILSILLAAFTILVPVFQRMSRDELRAARDREQPDLVRFCPRCGKRVDRPAGDVACAACGARATIRFIA